MRPTCGFLGALASHDDDGHAWVADALGQDLGRVVVTIQDQKGRLGMCRYEMAHGVLGATAQRDQANSGITQGIAQTCWIGALGVQHGKAGVQSPAGRQGIVQGCFRQGGTGPQGDLPARRNGGAAVFVVIAENPLHLAAGQHFTGIGCRQGGKGLFQVLAEFFHAALQ